MQEKQEIEIHIKASYKKFYSDSSNFGIYVASVNSDSPNQDLVKDIDEMFRDINIVGSMPELEIGKLYIAKVTEKSHPQYGLQYEIKSIYQKPFTTREEQIMFISALLTPKQIESITNAYPTENLIELIKDSKMDLDLVKGIGEKTFDKIREKILNNEKYQLAIVELTGKFDIPYNAVKRLSDKYGSPDLLLQKVNKNPYILTEVDGFGFKRVDEIALAMGIDKKSKNRIKSCIEYVLNEQANNGHCWVKRTKVVSDAIKLLNIKISDVQEVINDVEKTDTYCSDDKDRMYLVEYLVAELEIYRHINRLLDEKVEYKINNIEGIIQEVETRQGFKFTEEQLTAINYAVEHNIVVVNGKAGTGKTSVIQGIVEVLKRVESEQPLEYATCALSGKASQRIQESTGLDSYTIHRILGYNPNLGWVNNEDNPMGYDIIILDEASMVNSTLFHYLIRAIKSGAKFIITGDTAQLEPIGVGNILVDILASDIVPSVELTIVHRQAQKSGILSSANMVRDGIKFLNKDDFGTARLGELKDLYTYSYQSKEKVLNTVLKIAKQFKDKGDIMDFQILAPMKNRGELSTQNLNNEMQKIFNADPSNVDKRRKIERKNVTFLEDDKVIINGNNYDKGVFNGTMGIIEFIDTAVQNGEIVINFDGVGRITFTKEEMNKIDLGYAITIHKSQGSQWKYVVMAIDYSSYVLLNRQSTYTGMTRAKENLFLVTELKALQYSIDTDKSSDRNTFLIDFLRSAK
jgi:RecD/TraA family predicted helicase